MGRCLFMRKGETHTAPSAIIEITVKATDKANALSTLLNEVGVLTVSGNKVTSSPTVLSILPNIEVTYTLSRTIGLARTLVVNGVTIGTVKSSGDTVTINIHASDGDTVTIQFNK